MAQIGNEVVDRPPVGKNVDEQAAAELEALEQVNAFSPQQKLKRACSYHTQRILPPIFFTVKC